MTDQGGGANHVVAGPVVISEQEVICIRAHNITVPVAKGMHSLGRGEVIFACGREATV